MNYLYEYLIFLAQAVTVVAALLVVLSAFVSMAAKRRSMAMGHLEVFRLNDHFDNLKQSIEQALLPPAEFRKAAKRAAKRRKMHLKKASEQVSGESPTKLRGRAAGGQRPDEQNDADQGDQHGGDGDGGNGADTDYRNATEASDEAAASNQTEADKTGSAKESEAGESGQESGTATEEPPPGRVFVITFKGDLQASHVTHLRHEINAILAEAHEGDEVVARVESPGGLVQGYGLAASQLLRVRNHNLNLVVAVDKVAASGGYLMAAVANRVIAAPFAVVGSIGVVAQIPNVHRLLKKKDVDVEVLTAGKYKRTLTVFGENTEEGRQKFLDDMEDLHVLFQEFLADKRPGLDLEKVATGEAWYGQRALDLHLVDEIQTSDEYLMNRCAETDVFEIRWREPQKPLEKVLSQVENRVEGLLGRLFQRLS